MNPPSKLSKKSLRALLSQDDHYYKKRFGTKASEMADQMNSHQEIHYSSDNYGDYVLETFLKDKYNLGLSIRCYYDESVWIKKDSQQELASELEKAGMILTQRNYLYGSNSSGFIELQSAGDDFDHVRIYAVNQQYADSIKAIVDKHACNEKKLSFRWIYSGEGHSIDIIEECDETVTAAHYPFIKDFDTFIQRFIESKSNILILQGDPGTGKTSLIRQIMLALEKQAYVTYDQRVLQNDNSFAQYMDDDDAGAFVIEDADLFLKSRADGNSMVGRFLNIGDGLIKMKKKKLIFSTNLPNLRDIDSALIRPGRCFDIVEFRPLTRTEAEVVAKERGLTLAEGKETFTIAEIFNSETVPSEPKKKRTFGFI